MTPDAPRPEPVYTVRCTARGCDWSVQSNVAKRLAMFWRWHAASHPVSHNNVSRQPI